MEGEVVSPVEVHVQGRSPEADLWLIFTCEAAATSGPSAS